VTTLATIRARSRAALRRVARPIVAKVNARSGAVSRAEVEALHHEIERLRDDLERRQREHDAELALLRAQLAADD
jgi:hypothetical protein